MKTYCNECKFIKEPKETLGPIGKTWGPYTCENPINKTVSLDWLGKEVINYSMPPYERNKNNNCRLYENALTGERNLDVDPIVSPTLSKEQLSFLITEKKIAFGKEIILKYSSMNTLKSFNSSQVIQAGQKFASIQMLLLGGSIDTVYQIICALVPDEIVNFEDINYFKLLFEQFKIEISPLEERLQTLINE